MSRLELITIFKLMLDTSNIDVAMPSRESKPVKVFLRTSELPTRESRCPLAALPLNIHMCFPFEDAQSWSHSFLQNLSSVGSIAHHQRQVMLSSDRSSTSFSWLLLPI
jgi:hypothetical protein